jgi:hypothetical protein
VNGAELTIPAELPFLAGISWFDPRYRDLEPLEMLRRYESGWRFLGVLAELPSSPAIARSSTA